LELSCAETLANFATVAVNGSHAGDVIAGDVETAVALVLPGCGAMRRIAGTSLAVSVVIVDAAVDVLRLLHHLGKAEHATGGFTSAGERAWRRQVRVG